jgi:uncharacterized protein (DUF58 family)
MGEAKTENGSVTRELRRLVILTVLVLLLNPVFLSSYVGIADALLGLVWLDYFLKSKTMKQLKIERTLSSTRLFVNENLLVGFNITNPTSIPIHCTFYPCTGLPSVSKREASVSLLPNARMTQEVEGTFYTRGKKQIGKTTLSYSGPFELFKLWKTTGFEEKILVFPYFEDVVFTKERLRLLLPGRKTEYRLLEDSTKIKTTREYVNEPLNRMNWKLSARFGKLMTKDFETTSLGKVHLCVDMNMPDGVLINDAWKYLRKHYEEYVVNVAGSILKELKSRGTNVVLTIVGEEIWQDAHPGTEFVMYLETLIQAYGVESPLIKTSEVLKTYVDKAAMDETLVLITMHLTEKEIPLLLQLRARCAKVIVWLMPYGYRPSDAYRSRSYEMPHPEAAKLLEHAKILEENRIIVKFFMDNDALQEVIDRVP